MPTPLIIIDTNVIVAAARSSRGASYKLVSLLPRGCYRLALSVPLVLEYEDVLMRQPDKLSMSREKVGDFIDQLCNVAEKYEIYFLWRPILRDPKDDHILELAVASGARYVVTYNRKDFVGLDKFNVEVVDAKEMLDQLGELS